MYAALEVRINLAPRCQAKAFVQTGFGQVVEVVLSHVLVDTAGVTQAIDGRIVVAGDTSLLGVDPGHARLVGDAYAEVGGAELFAVERSICRWYAVAVERLEEHGRRGQVLLRANLSLQAQTVGPFAVPQQAVVFVVHHVIYGVPFEGYEYVVFVRRQELVARCHNVAIVSEGQIVHRELARQIPLLVERISRFAQTHPFVVAETICHVAAKEDLRMQIGRSLCRSTQAQTIDKVLRDNCIHWANVYFRRLLWVRACFYEVFDKGLADKYNWFKRFDLLQAFYESLHPFFAGREFLGALLFPIGFVAHVCFGVDRFVPHYFEITCRNVSEGKLAIICGTLHLHFLQEVYDFQMHQHIIAHHYMFATFQQLKFLYYPHLIHKVHA